MSLNKYKLGDLITQRREKNSGDSLPISGVSKDGLIPPKQQEADTSLYNVFYRGDFIFNPARMELNSIAYNDKYDKAICSSLYEVFYVHRTDLIMPEFLALIVKQDWFTRYCEFLGQGSAREYCRFANISDIEIEFPDLNVQSQTVNHYNIIKGRITLKQRLNDYLEMAAQAFYAQMFMERAAESWKTGILSDIAVITMGQSPQGDTFNEIGNGTVFYQGRTDFGFRFPTRRLYTTEPKRMALCGDALMSVRAPVGDLNVAYEECCIGRGLAAIHSKDNHQSFLLYTLFTLNKQLDVFNSEGTVFGSINKESLNSMEITIPPIELINKFESIANPIDRTIRNNYEEIYRLQAIRDTLLPKLMNGEIDVSAVRI